MTARRVGLVVAIVWAAGAGAACAPRVARVVSEGSPPAGDAGDYAPAIRSEAMWRLLAARPGTEHMARSEVVKVIVDRSDGEVYFMESKRWPIHFFFAARFLNKPGRPVEDQALFNRRQYKAPAEDRRFVLGTVTHALDADRWVFDLFAGDTLSLEATADAFRRTRDRVFFGAALAYRPVPPHHERDIERARALMPVVTTDELYGKIRYQPSELGEAFGYLRVFARGARFEPAMVRPYDVVVLAEQPPDIPVVSGVITDELQAPLGHISVLCHNRKTPNMTLRGASDSAEVKALAGKLVHLTVGAQGYRLEPATQAQAEASWAKKRPAKGFRPARNDRTGRPAVARGARAARRRARRGEDRAARLRGQPAAARRHAARLRAAVPCVRPLPARDRPRAQADGDAGRSASFQKDPEARRARLDAFRAEMTAATVPPDIVADVIRRARQTLPPGRVRLRSSTNAEDLPGFNGAGLYRSTRVDPGDPADVARGLREVWASTWLWAAFEEREYYRIDHRTVGMAILVQESIDDDVANGVAITANPFSQGNPGFFINAQLSSGSVTGAKGDEIPEQILVLHVRRRATASNACRARSRRAAASSWRRPSSTSCGSTSRFSTAPSPTTIPTPSRAAPSTSSSWSARTPPHIVIVQARPFDVTWGPDRLWRDEDGAPVAQ